MFFYDKNYTIDAGSSDWRLAYDNFKNNRSLPIHHIHVDHDFSVEFQPRYKNKFATPEIIREHGADEFVFTIFIKNKNAFQKILDLFTCIDKPYIFSGLANLKFYGFNEDEFFLLKNVWWRPILINEALYRFNDEMMEKYAKKGRCTKRFGHDIVHLDIDYIWTN